MVSNSAKTGLLTHLADHPVPPEEVRFAVVLNGGVSLAVWMGGVVLELDRLTKAELAAEADAAYSLLKLLTGCSARVDVITGTSAGGINGAALALTQVNRHKDPAMLRDLWIDQGRIESLLRQPFQGEPTSLLRGDEYFLPRLHSALEMLATPADTDTVTDPREAPIDLSITTTVLRGNQAVSVDSTGQLLPQSLHAARFHWQRLPGRPAEEDPFSREHLPRTAHRLALASRSSASFPVAFEPSFVPVGSPDHREPAADHALSAEVRLRPDMGDLVESWGTGRVGSDRSRFCVDGGVLANTPTLAALQACEAMPAAGPVRRLVLLVFPHAPSPGLDPADKQGAPPTVTGALSGLLGALTAQGGRSYVEALERHNLAAAGRRGARGDILEQIKTPAGLTSLVRSIYPQYQRLRRWRAGRDLAARRTGTAIEAEFSVSDLPPDWGFERVRAAAAGAQEKWARSAPAEGRAALPYVPSSPPTPDTVSENGWRWGITTALGVTEVVNDLLRRLVWVLPPGPDYEAVEQARNGVLQLAEKIRQARDLTDACWRDQPALLGLAPDQSYWQLRLASYDYLMCGDVTLDEVRTAAGKVHPHTDTDLIMGALTPTLKPDMAPGHAGRQVRNMVNAVIRLLRPTLGVLADRADELAALDEELAHWRRALFPGSQPERLGTAVLLTRLLQLEVASTTLGDEVSTGATLPVELVQVSAQTQNPFAAYSTTAHDKLGGDAINRFGGFLKRSWRVNDWIWGRADGATALSRAMLDPRRIRRAARLSGYLTEQSDRAEATLLATATADEILDRLQVTQEAADLRPAVIKELTDVFDLTGVEDGDLPAALSKLGAVFAWALHLDALPGELPALAQAIAADRVDGANPRSRGELFLAQQTDLIRRLDTPSTGGTGPSSQDRRDALDAFDRAGIGWESLREEASSDLMIRTAASAAAVASTVADSKRSGLSAAKPVTRALRGTMLLPYWAIWGLSSRQTIARGLSLLALALGGTALALALFGVLSTGLQPIAAALGAGALLAGFAYGALRTGSLLHSVVLLTPVIPLTAYAVTAGHADATGVSTVVIVAALALGLIGLGSIGVASGSVWAALDTMADRQGFIRPRPAGSARSSRTRYTLQVWLRRVASVLWALSTLVGLALLALLVALLAWRLVDPSVIEFVQANHRWLWLPALAVVALGGFIANQESRWFSVLTRRPGAPASAGWEYAAVVAPRATGAGWSVIYGSIYLLVAWVASLEALGAENPLWRRVVFATAVTFALTLLIVVPVVMPLVGLLEIARAEIDRADTTTGSADPEAAARQRLFADDLLARGTSYRRFVGFDDTGAVLTKAGGMLEQRVSDARAAVALVRAWNAPRVLSPDDVGRLPAVLAQWSDGPGAVISPAARKRLTDVHTVLASGSPDPAHLRHSVDRLIATLHRA